MRSYVCTATFTDPRIKPRVAVIETAGTRSDARKAGRKEIEAAVAGKGWEIAQVTATVDTKVAEPAGKVVAVAKAKSSRTRQPADPAKKAAALVADEADPSHGPFWWTVYRAVRADQRLGVIVEPHLALVPAS